MALLSKKPIARVQQFLTSKTDDYENWKTRRILGIQPEGSSDWFFTVHMGWWNEEEEPFVDQWKCIQETLKDSKYREGTIWLMGDFNSQDDVRGEGYDLVLKNGWKDTYLLAEEKDDGITVAEEIDGWVKQMDAAKQQRMKSGWITYSVIRRQMSALRTLSVTERMHRSYRIITEL